MKKTTKPATAANNATGSKKESTAKNVKETPKTETAPQAASTATETETLEKPQEETPNETPTTPAVATRRVFWHKACADEKLSTLTKMKPEDSLKLTDGTVTKDGTIFPVLSLKRGKRIYYIFDVSPEELAAAKKAHKETLDAKEADRKAKEALKNKEKETTATPAATATSEATASKDK